MPLRGTSGESTPNIGAGDDDGALKHSPADESLRGQTRAYTRGKWRRVSPRCLRYGSAFRLLQLTCLARSLCSAWTMDENTIILQAGCKLLCPKCPAKLKDRKLLRYHLLTAHKTNAVLAGRAVQQFACSVCDLTFARKSSLKLHIVRAHPEIEIDVWQPNFEQSFRCALCGHQEYVRQKLISHMQHGHPELGVRLLTREFKSLEAFEAFKKATEQNIACSFVKRDAAASGSKYLYYNCSHEEPRRASSASQHSLAKFCSAFIRATVEKTGVSASFCLQHFGHAGDASSSPLSREERAQLEAWVGEGLDVDDVLSRCEAREPGARLFYTTRADVAKLLKACRLTWLVHPDDSTSLFAFVNSRAGAACVRDLSASDNSADFYLLLITPVQLRWLDAHANRGLYVDCVADCTPHRYTLTTLLVADELDRPLPAAYLLSSHARASNYARLFSCVRRLLPAFDPEYLIADDSSSSFDGLLETNQPYRTRKLLCLWSFGRAITRDIESTLTDPQSLQTIGALFNTAVRCTKECDFKRAVAELSNFCEEANHYDFLKRITSAYLWRADEWALFSRLHAPFSAVMSDAAYYGYLKTHKLERQENLRIDYLVSDLLRTAEEKEIEYQMQDRRKHCSASYRIARTHANHSKALCESTNNCSINRTPSGFEVQNETERFELKFIEECACPEQNEHCIFCNACPHQLSCSCSDGVEQGIVCKHVHMLSVCSEDDSSIAQHLKHIIAQPPTSSSSDVPSTSATDGDGRDVAMEERPPSTQQPPLSARVKIEPVDNPVISEQATTQQPKSKVRVKVLTGMDVFRMFEQDQARLRAQMYEMAQQNNAAKMLKFLSAHKKIDPTLPATHGAADRPPYFIRAPDTTSRSSAANTDARPAISE